MVGCPYGRTVGSADERAVPEGSREQPGAAMRGCQSGGTRGSSPTEGSPAMLHPMGAGADSTLTVKHPTPVVLRRMDPPFAQVRPAGHLLARSTLAAPVQERT
jgi:hypothetical protein